MRLLAESVDRSIVERLRADGHAVHYVAEDESGIADDVVLSRANELGALLVTADGDFGELVFRLGRAHAGVVLLRLAGLSASPHFSPVAAMIAEDFGSVCVLATESIAGPTVEVACAHTGPKDRRGRGQRSL